MNFMWIFLLLQISFSCTITNKKGNSDMIRLQMLSEQLTSLKGVSKCTLFIDKHIKCDVIEKLQKLISRSVPLTSMKSKSISWSRCERKLIYESVRYFGNFREQRSLLNYPSANALFIYVFSHDVDKTFKEFNDRWIFHVYLRLSCATTLPKVLVINLARKTAKVYKRKVFSDIGVLLLDLDVLEISNGDHVPRNGKKLRAEPMKFRLHQVNPFTKSYKRQKLSKGTKWFENRHSNLYGYKMITSYRRRRDLCFDRITKKTVVLDGSGPHSELGKYLSTAVNCTFKIKKASARFSPEIDFPELVVMLYHIQSNFLNPCQISASYFYTPVIVDVAFENNFNGFLMCFSMVPVVLFLLHICRFLGGFDKHTWSPLYTTKMLFGLDSPYDPRFVVECALFIVISICGIFCANDFYEALMDVIVPVRSERQFYTLQDLKGGNLTLYIQGEASRVPGGYVWSPPQKIAHSGLNYKLINDRVQRELVNMHLMRLWQNISISVVDTAKTKYYERTITFDGRAIARQSDIAEYSLATSIGISPFNVFKDSLSKFYWYFHEHGLKHLPLQYSNCYFKLNSLMPMRGSDLLSRDTDEDIDEDPLFLLILVIILISGLAAALAALFAEVVFCR